MTNGHCFRDRSYTVERLTSEIERFFRLSDGKFIAKHVQNYEMGFNMYK